MAQSSSATRGHSHQGKIGENIVWTEAITKGIRIPTNTKKDVAMPNDAARMTILRVQVILTPKNVAEKKRDRKNTNKKKRKHKRKHHDRDEEQGQERKK